MISSYFLGFFIFLSLDSSFCGKSAAGMIECVACFSANNCRQVRLAELHRRGDGQDLDVRAGWRILDFEWVSLQHKPTIARPVSCKKGVTNRSTVCARRGQGNVENVYKDEEAKFFLRIHY